MTTARASAPAAGGPARAGTAPRSALRAVAVPTEHGGWGLTLEPVLLGLLVAPSWAGLFLGLAAFGSFLARTPLKVLLVDTHRQRTLERTRLARRVFAAEAALLAALAAGALVSGEPGFWVPVVAIAPLVLVELWFDMRSRSRRLLPELAGAVGIAGVAAMILLAGGESGAVAAAAWLLLGGRAVTAIVSVRDLVGAMHDRARQPRAVLAGELVAVVAAAAAVAVERDAVAGALAVVAAVAAQRALGRRPPARAAILGIRQMVVGIVVVLVAAAGFTL